MTRAKGNLTVFVVALAALMIASAHSTSNGVVKQPVRVVYTLGAGDSRLDAIENAREMARRKAVSESGSYIQGTTLLSNGELSETIQVLKASYVRLTGEETALRLTDQAPNGELVYDAIAEIDESAMQRRIEVMNQDRDLQRQVAALVSENERLRARIDGVVSSPDTSRLQADRKRLVLRSQLLDNQETLKSMFKQGSLLDMRKAADANLLLQNQRLYRSVIEPLTEGGVSAEIESIGGENGMTKAKVRMSYEAPDEQVIASLLNAFKRKKNSSSVSSYYRDKDHSWSERDLRRAMEDQELDNDYALEQQDFIGQFLVMVEIELGHEKRYFPILGVQRQSSFRTRECDKQVYTVDQLKKSGWVTRKVDNDVDFLCLHNSGQTRSQQVEITMSNEEAASVRSIQARRVLVEIGKLEQI